jgi:phosphatidate cytidylyltransferase
MAAMLTPNAALALAGIVGLLVIATVGVALFNRLKPASGVDELAPRIRSWWIMVATFSVALALGRAASLAALGLISFLALKEYLSVVPGRRADRPLLLFAYATIPLQYYWIGVGHYELFLILAPFVALAVMPAGMALVGETEGFLRAAGTLSWGLLITVFALGHLGFLVVLPAAANPAGGAVGLLMYLVFLAQSGDVVQYLAGKSLGRHKVLPGVSPNKTWEGLVAGLLWTAVIGAALAPALTPLGRAEGLAAGLLIGLAGFAGDATMSAMKRDLGVKDTAALIPGHGGILDRVDSLIFSAPLFFHLVYTAQP